VANAFISSLNTQTMHKSFYTQQYCYVFPKNLIPWRDSNPGLLVPEADGMMSTEFSLFFFRPLCTGWARHRRSIEFREKNPENRKVPATRVPGFLCTTSSEYLVSSGADPAVASCNAGAVKIYSSNLVRFENHSISFYKEKLQRCSCKFRSSGIGSWICAVTNRLTLTEKFCAY
jgi:hypothetical protein